MDAHVRSRSQEGGQPAGAPRRRAEERERALVAVALMVAGCGAGRGAAGSADRAGTPAVRASGTADRAGGDADRAGPGAAAGVGGAAAGGCLTIRDQELACDRRCDAIEPVLRACARGDAHGSILVHAHWDGVRTTTQLELRGAGLDEAAACVTRVFARYVPCLGASAGPQDATLPLLLSGS